MRFLLLASWLLTALPAQIPDVRVKKPKPDPSDAFFADNEIPTLHLQLPPTTIAALRAQPREYAHASLTCNGDEPLADVGVKLKGAAGSFRNIDEERPGFTIKLDKFAPDARLFGLRKFHLNNAAQDGTLLHEWLASEICRAAGTPATRVAWARVRLNGKDLGLYVLKESFDKQFLARWFTDVEGNLYDGGFLNDLDADLEKDSGSGRDDRGDLRKLIDASAHEPPRERWQRLEQLLDIEAFTTFEVLERMLAHWDGYCLNRNNYRVYFEPKSGRAWFLPHGMDQVFGDAGMSMYSRPVATLATAVWTNPQWRAAQKKRLGELLPLLQSPKLLQRLEAMAARLQQAMARMDGNVANQHADAVRDLKERLTARARNLAEQFASGAPKPMVLAAGRAQVLHGWHEHSECDDARLEQTDDDGRRVLTIGTGPSARCIAGWRTTVLLARGRYKFTASVRVEGLAELADVGRCGAQLRSSCAEAGAAVMTGKGWQNLVHEFEVKEDQDEVDLIAELRAGAGAATLRVDTLKLARR